jgi:hypothetical protein
LAATLPKATQATTTQVIRVGLAADPDKKDFIESVPERRKMMQEWADYLDNLKAGAQVIPFRKIN